LSKLGSSAPDVMAAQDRLATKGHQTGTLALLTPHDLSKTISPSSSAAAQLFESESSSVLEHTNRQDDRTATQKRQRGGFGNRDDVIDRNVVNRNVASLSCSVSKKVVKRYATNISGELLKVRHTIFHVFLRAICSKVGIPTMAAALKIWTGRIRDIMPQ
jgi:hypothetical protein